MDRVAGAADARATDGEFFDMFFCESAEQPKIVNRMPADANKETMLIVDYSQSVGRRSNGCVLKVWSSFSEP